LKLAHCLLQAFWWCQHRPHLLYAARLDKPTCKHIPTQATAAAAACCAGGGCWHCELRCELHSECGLPPEPGCWGCCCCQGLLCDVKGKVGLRIQYGHVASRICLSVSRALVLTVCARCSFGCVRYSCMHPPWLAPYCWHTSQFKSSA
jgi:hypothetical protein